MAKNAKQPKDKNQLAKSIVDHVTSKYEEKTNHKKDNYGKSNLQKHHK